MTDCPWCTADIRCPWCSIEEFRARGIGGMMTYDECLHAFWASLDIVPSETTECLPWIHPETGELFDCYCLYRRGLARSAEWHSCDTA